MANSTPGAYSITPGAHIIQASAGGGSLTATPLTAQAPVLGTPAAGQVHTLAAADLTAQAATVGAPAAAQHHVLTASGLVAQAPVLGTPALVVAGAGDVVRFQVERAPVRATVAIGPARATAEIGPTRATIQRAA